MRNLMLFMLALCLCWWAGACMQRYREDMRYTSARAMHGVEYANHYDSRQLTLGSKP